MDNSKRRNSASFLFLLALIGFIVLSRVFQGAKGRLNSISKVVSTSNVIYAQETGEGTSNDASGNTDSSTGNSGSEVGSCSAASCGSTGSSGSGDSGSGDSGPGDSGSGGATGCWQY